MIYTKSTVDAEAIKHLLENEEWLVRYNAIKACIGREVPLKIIKQGLDDVCDEVRVEAMKVCKNRDVPLGFIKQGLEDSYSIVRIIALMGCKGKDIPPEWIEPLLHDENFYVSYAAWHLCQGRSNLFGMAKHKPLGPEKGGLYADIAIISRDIAMASHSIHLEPYCKRTFEPPVRVYQKCEHGVIVVAEIPKDALVRGQLNQKCRASKAKIVDIIGDYYGEKIGISYLDESYGSCYFYYFVGDEIEIDDFNPSYEEWCHSGFNFFCTLGRAKNY